MTDPLDVTNQTDVEIKMQNIEPRDTTSKSIIKPVPGVLPVSTVVAPGTNIVTPTVVPLVTIKPRPKLSPPNTPTSSVLHQGESVNKPKPAETMDLVRLAARRRVLTRQALKSEFEFLTVPDCVRLHPLLGAYLAEATGTFLFVLTIALVTINNPGTKGRPDTNITPIPIGFMLMCMVFTFGYISGGHFNPAITFAVFLAGKMDIFRAVGYILAQCGAALGAGIVAMIIQGDTGIVVPDVQNNGTYIRKGVFSELIYTFALATVVLNVAYSRQQGNFFYGFAIGMTVVAGGAAVGGVSGGAFNPAVAIGLQTAVCLVGRCTPLMHFWIYWVSPLIGAALATLLFKSLWQPDVVDSQA